MRLFQNKKWLKRILKTIIVFACIFIAVLVTSSPFAKYFIEKYDTYYTGREITVESAYMNPFTGYISLGNLKIYEENSDSVFFKAESLSADFSMLKMLYGTYEIAQLKLIKPKGNIIQDSARHLNFKDWIIRWSPKKHKHKHEPTHFNILDIEVNDGQFYYIEKSIPVNYDIKHVNLKSTGFQWYSDTVATQFSFDAGRDNGHASGKFTVNTSNVDYTMNVQVKKYGLNFIKQYLQEFINYGDFRANFDANIKASGNFKEAQNVIASGMICLNDFHIGKNRTEDYAAFSSLKFKVNKLSPLKGFYDFDSVLLENPYAKYEQFDDMDNIEHMFGKKGQNVAIVNASRGSHNLIIQLAKYIEKLARNFLKSNYRVNRFEIANADLRFEDYAINECFTVQTSPLTLTCDSANKNHKRVRVHVASKIKPYGNLKLDASINPRDSSDFDFTFTLRNFAASTFNPYLISYTSYPLNRGIVELTGIWNVLDGNIRSNNNIQVIDARLAKHVRNKDNKRFPVWLAMFLVRDNYNIINYEIPVSGNLRDPKFHWRDVVDDIVWNLFSKPPETFKREHIKHVETEIEDSKQIFWEMNSYELERSQQKFLEKIDKFLGDDPKAIITIQPFLYSEKEKEHMLLFEVKKHYYMHVHGLNKINRHDSVQIQRMSIKDSLFIKYISSLCRDKLLFSVQAKAYCIYAGKIEKSLKQLHKQRVNSFLSHFNSLNQSRIKFMNYKQGVPFNGFSYFEILYKGNIPSYLDKAYQKMDKLDNKSPRNAYKKYRRKNRRRKRDV
jgi:hypothetical protein